MTRSRQKLTVVSSFNHLNLDLARVRPGGGVELLRNYLQYASTNGKRLGDAEVTGEPLNAFEAEVFDCLSMKGLKLIPQMGASRFRIDMVAEHPTKPGRHVLANECDGATYHSSYTARDRDRLRRQQLENLGWRFHRIWSTDWFMRKEDEIQRALKAFGESAEFADKLDGGVVQNHHGNGLHYGTPSAAPKRGPRPPSPIRTSISEYSETLTLRRVCVTYLRPASSGQSGEGFRVVSHAVLGARVNANRLSELVATQNSDCSGVAEEFGLTV